MEISTSSGRKLNYDRRYLIIGIFIVVAFASGILGLRYGAYPIDSQEFMTVILSRTENKSLTYQILWHIRLPRVMTGFLVGTCLALAGALLQGIMRNALASPNIIGVSSGAGLAATVCMALMPSAFHLIPLYAFVGGFVTTVIIYLLAYKNGIRPLRMVLAGVAVSSFASAVINLLLILYPDSVADSLSFTIGSLSLATWQEVKRLLPYGVIAVLTSLFFGRRMNVMLLGDRTARSLGIHVEGTRLLLIGIASLLSAASVSTVGLLGFVGLIVPHVTRMLLGNDYKYLMPGCILVGGSIVVLADLLSRTLLAPMEIPVGILMAMLGVPFFLGLMRRRLVHD